ncbi:hypothetical protein [Paenibacillus sp. GXUN7292]|uniref:hypothetical protein n=1 Tax=Paenibacillus sp. GXUN7292 TaxID=3422499 RepID=UPI003D7EF9FD
MKTAFWKKKPVIVLLFIAALCFSSLGSAYAAANMEPIKAFFNHKISFVLNGELWSPKDDAGKALTPIHYEGRNYLPVRAVAEALKVPIEFDSATQKIYIGSLPGGKTPILAVPFEIDQIYVKSSRSAKDTLIHNEQYAEVLKIDQYGDIEFTVDRKYKWLVLDTAIVNSGEHEVEFSLYNAGKSAGNAAETVLETHSINPEDQTKRLVFNVEGLEKIKIHVQSPNLNPYIYARIMDTSYFDNEKPAPGAGD